MQVVSNNFRNLLKSTTRDLVAVVEIYKADAVPGPNGFDPATPDLLLAFAKTNVTYRYVNYSRYVTNYGDVNRKIGKEVSTFNFTVSNSDRFIIDYEYGYGFEGKIVVVRIISRSTSANLDDSIVVFTGRCKRPKSLKKSNETLIIPCEQILNQSEVKIPRRTCSTEDTEGRPQSDPEWEGFVYSQRVGTVNYKTTERSRFLLFFSKNKTITKTMPYSSHSGLEQDTPLPVVLGRSQVELIMFAYEDKGTWINLLGFWCDGHEKGIFDVQSVRSVTNGMYLPNTANKMGKKGGYIDGPDTQANDDPGWIGAGIHAKTAYLRAVALGTTAESDDPAPNVVGIIIGQIMPVSNGSNFSGFGWSDIGPEHARWLLNSIYFYNFAAVWFDDTDTIRSINYCNQVLVDQTNSEAVILHDSQQGLAGNIYKNYVSTAILSPSYYKKGYSDYLLESDYTYYETPPYNSDDPTGIGVPHLPPTLFRRRYNSNLQLKEQMKCHDFLYDVILPAFNGYIVQKANGKISIRVRKPIDFSFVYAQGTTGTNSIQVLSIEAWRFEPGQVLIGANTPTSEVRTVIGTRYKPVTIPLSCSGLVFSGNIQGGDVNNPSSAIITVNDSAGQKTIQVDAHVLKYNPKADDTTQTTAALIAAQINSHEILTRYIKAEANNNVVTVKSKIGYLDLDANLNNVHRTSINSPMNAPNLSPIAGGNLMPGKYQVCYSYVTVEGESLTSPVSEIYLSQQGRIETPSLVMPARVIAINWYVSTETNGVRRRRARQNLGSGFIINSLPKTDEKMEPVLNATAEEIHRVALAFTDKANPQTNLTRSNVLKGTFEINFGERSSTINQVKGTYIDASQDFKRTSYTINDRANQRRIKKTNPKEINLTAVDSYHQAYRLLNQQLAIEVEGDVFSGVSSEGEALLLEEFDPICITDESGRYINKPLTVEDLIFSLNEYPTVTIPARIYNRKFYDDQVAEKLVPIPVVQNVEPNKEQNAPSLYIESVTNTEIIIGVKNYSTMASHRLIQWTADPEFENDVKERVETAQNGLAGNILKDKFSITRTTNLANAETVNIRVQQSTNGETYGTWAYKTAAFPAATGGGGSEPETPPPTVLCASLSALTYNNSVSGHITNNGGVGTIRVYRKFNDGGGDYVYIQGLPAQSQDFSDNPTVSGSYSYVLNQDGAGGQSEVRIVNVTVPEQPQLQPPVINQVVYEQANQKTVTYFTPRGGSRNFTVDRNYGQGWVRRYTDQVGANDTAFADQDAETAQASFTKAIGYRIARHEETGFSNEVWVEIPALPVSNNPPVLQFLNIAYEAGNYCGVYGVFEPGGGSGDFVVYYDDIDSGQNGLTGAFVPSGGPYNFLLDINRRFYNYTIAVYVVRNTGESNRLFIQINGTYGGQGELQQ